MPSATDTIASYLERGQKIKHAATGVVAWTHSGRYFVRGADAQLDSFDTAADAARFVVRETGIGR